MTHTITVINRKAGVGKTTTAFNLAVALLKNKKSVSLLDLDAQQDLVSLSGKYRRLNVLEFDRNGYDIRPALQSAKTDYILIDCPPRLDSAEIEGKQSLQSMACADTVLLPTIADRLSLRGAFRLIDAAALVQEQLNPQLQVRILATMYRPVLHKEELKQLKKNYPEAVCKTTIPSSVPVVQAIAVGRSVLDVAPESPGARAYRKLAEEIMSWQD